MDRRALGDVLKKAGVKDGAVTSAITGRTSISAAIWTNLRFHAVPAPA